MSNEQLFNDVADYYAKYRPDLPEEVANYIVNKFPTTKGVILDLGCGTGQVARALYDFAGEIYAVDPSKEMIKNAKKAVDDRENKVEFICQSAEKCLLPHSSIDLIIIARAFHWMDQDVVLKNSRSILKPNGGFVSIDDKSLWTGSANWQHTAKKTIQYFLGEERRAGNSYFTVPKESYEEMLKRYGFTSVEVKKIELKKTWDFKTILGYIYTNSYSLPYMFGDRMDEFENKLREDLGNPDDKDTFIENADYTITSGINI